MGSGVNLNDPRSATERGWGRMWTPNTAPRRDMVPLVVEGVPFVGGVHPELHELLAVLWSEALDRGYKLREKPLQTWGFAWRPIRGTEVYSGGAVVGGVPTNHSAGTAVDANSAVNYLGRTDGGDVPKWLVDLFNDYGFRWGGDYTGRQDPMHFEFMGTTADAKRLTEKARKELVDMALTDDQKDALQFVIGERLQLADKPEPAEPGPRRQGWRFAENVAAAIAYKDGAAH